MRETKYRKPFFMLTAIILSLIFCVQADAIYSNSMASGGRSNITTQYVESYSTIPADRISLSADFEKVLENNTLAIYYRETDAQIRILDKKAGYLWGGLPADDAEGLNRAWRGMASSFFSIEYVNEVNTGKQLSIADSEVEKSMKVTGSRLEVTFNYKKLKISGKVYLELLDDRIAAGFTADDFTEDGEYLITNAYIMPFLGTTVGDELPGYMFIPDGPGALVRFRKPTHYLSPYSAKVYGKDYGIDAIYDFDDSNSIRPTDYRTAENKAMVPVFGMSHGEQYAYVGSVTKGAEYTSIVCYPSGVVTDYNWVTAAYHFRQKYLQPVDRSGAGVYTARHARYPVDVKVEYKFLSGNDATYAGMARSYRQDLLESNVLPDYEIKDSRLPIRVELIGYDVRKKFIFSSVVPVTNVKQAASIADKLMSMSIQPTLVYQGYQKGGLNGSALNKFTAADGFKKLRQLQQTVLDGGGRFYLQDRSMSGSSRQVKSKFAMTMSMAQIKTALADRTILFPDTFYIKPSAAADNLSAKLKSYGEEGFKSLSLLDYTGVLYSDNNQKDRTSRIDALNVLQAPLKDGTEDGFAFVGYTSYAAMWPYTTELFDMPVYTSRYMFETDTVPFIPMVLKGSIDCYSPYVNQSFYTDVDILRMVEYGIYPSFLLTYKANKDLAGTRLTTYYSTQYEDWLPYMKEIADFMKEGILSVEGASMTDHYAAANGVMCSIFSNGCRIYVNYTQKAINIDGITIPAKNYSVKGGR